MPASEARILANRENARRSTGPKWPEGKERSRRNGLKHGMAGRGVVVPEGESAEVERRESDLKTEMGPRSTIGAILIRQMATLSVRMERGARQEMASVASRALRASEEYDEARIEAAEQILAGLADDPRGAFRRLRKSPEGVDLLIEGWRKLRAELTRPAGSRWDLSSVGKAANLAGFPVEDERAGRLSALTRATWGSFERLTDRDGAGLDRDARKAWAFAELVRCVDGQIAELQAHRESLDFGAIERDRAGAGDRSLFDPSREASLARRYESEARRGFFKALKEFREVEAEVDAEEEVESAESAADAPAEAPEVGRSEVPLASCREIPTPAPIGVPTRPAPAVGRGYDLARGLDGRVLAVGRMVPSPDSR